jgi:PAS domain-containing protein
MNTEGLPQSDDVLELHQVIDHLAQAEAALTLLMQGQVDAYIDPATATPRLLNEAQDWLLRSQQRLKQIHDAIACGVIVRDSYGDIVHANDPAS